MKVKVGGREEGRQQRKDWKKSHGQASSLKSKVNQRVTVVKMLMMGLRGSSDREICPAGLAQRGMK